MDWFGLMSEFLFKVESMVWSGLWPGVNSRLYS